MKTSILKDSSVRSIWTYVTASPCYTANKNKHDYATNRYYKSANKQLVNAVSQSCYRETESERERERERDRQTDRQTETDRQTDRQTETESCLGPSFNYLVWSWLPPSC